MSPRPKGSCRRKAESSCVSWDVGRTVRPHRASPQSPPPQGPRAACAVASPQGDRDPEKVRDSPWAWAEPPWSCPRLDRGLTVFLATGSSFIQVCRFLRARSTSFWQRMSSEMSPPKANCGGGIRGSGLGGMGRGSSA